MKKLVLLGANGQLGTDIQSIFTATSKNSLTNLTRTQVNLEEPYTITRVLKEIGEFDWLINCAALTHTEECEISPDKAYRINVEAVRKMASYCKFYRITFMHFSTDYIFDGKKEIPYIEEDEPNPLNVYGHTKLLSERAIRQETDRYFILRVSSLFGRAGKSGTGKNFIENIIAQARTGQELAVVSDQIMSPTHTLDVARTLKELIDNAAESYGTYHCASEGACSWYEFAVEALSRARIHANIRPVNLDNYPAPVKRPVFSALDTTKIKKIFPPKEWREALAEYLFLKNYI